MRLIDAKVLRTCFTEIPFDSLSSDELSIILKFYDAIDNAPTIDAEPVRHGYWIGLEYDGYADGFPVYDLWECSECGNEHKGEDTPNYCSNCGAKMRGDEDAAE